MVTGSAHILIFNPNGSMLWGKQRRLIPPSRAMASAPVYPKPVWGSLVALYRRYVYPNINLSFPRPEGFPNPLPESVYRAVYWLYCIVILMKQGVSNQLIGTQHFPGCSSVGTADPLPLPRKE